jgi:hypothetical protein
MAGHLATASEVTGSEDISYHFKMGMVCQFFKNGMVCPPATSEAGANLLTSTKVGVLQDSHNLFFNTV